jgi:hypothetical protein
MELNKVSLDVFSGADGVMSWMSMGIWSALTPQGGDH